MPYSFVYEHWVPIANELMDFPFSYRYDALVDEDMDHDIEMDVIMPTYNKEAFKKENASKIKEQVILNFDFSKYLNEYSECYSQDPNLELVLKMNIYKVRDKKRVLVTNKYLRIHSFHSKYRYNLLTTMDQLNDAMSSLGDTIAFDTETSGLNPEEDYIVGFSFSDGNDRAYYVPVRHDEKYDDLNLGIEAVEAFYRHMTKSKLIYMFNSRFDMRMLEYAGFDASKLNIRDAQVSAWFADPDFRKHNLKYLEWHFLGYKRPDLKTTLKASGSKNNLPLISPNNILFYAAQDALSTFNLGKATDRYYKEFGRSGAIDQLLLYPLMKMENHKIRVDIEFLEDQLNYILPRLDELNSKIKKLIGDINLNSPTQKAKLFKSYGLDTGVKTKKSGNMATGTKEVEAMIKKLKADGKDYPEWLEYLGERAKLEKLQSTFFGSLLEQAKLNGGRVRINYRNTQAATGRLSSGADFGKD